MLSRDFAEFHSKGEKKRCNIFLWIRHILWTKWKMQKIATELICVVDNINLFTINGPKWGSWNMHKIMHIQSKAEQKKQR